ncbi:hypothetical protein SAMN05192583_2687 [Sphingomonas gellani]|uniref:Uncharacterized protein n=1 Tax=Sphingomonas gellani TaxID=1166340 RepID=A0A1H8G488_9SPHN|nr:hypothetical protein [Sphingomonas gellani]SEN38590.1 hypothetical protein SAMN05192583_2687 [Sphingomonas gellani]
MNVGTGVTEVCSSLAKGDLDYVTGIDKRRVAAGPDGLRDTVAALLREGGAARVRYSPSTIACLRMALAFLDRAPLPAYRRAAWRSPRPPA